MQPDAVFIASSTDAAGLWRGNPPPGFSRFSCYPRDDGGLAEPAIHRAAYMHGRINSVFQGSLEESCVLPPGEDKRLFSGPGTEVNIRSNDSVLMAYFYDLKHARTRTEEEALLDLVPDPL